jgi:hypothetical protein
MYLKGLAAACLILITSPVQSQDKIVGDDKTDAAYPEAYWSTPTQTAPFELVKSVSENGVIKSFRGATTPSTRETAYDPRLNGTRYYATTTREVSNWQFTAVRTIDSLGRDLTTVTISGTALNSWNPFRPRDGILMSRNGFEVDFKTGPQVLHTHVTGSNFTGNLNRCSQPADTMSIPPFYIPNSVFEAMDNIVVRGKPEAYYGCP